MPEVSLAKTTYSLAHVIANMHILSAALLGASRSPLKTVYSVCTLDSCQTI